MCEWCEILVREPCCDLRLEQRRLSYGCQRVEILDGSRVVGRVKKEGRNSYGGFWYMFLGKFPIMHTGPRAGRVVLQLHLALNVLHRGPFCASVQMPQRRTTVHWVLLLGPV